MSQGTGRGDGVWQAILGGGSRHSPLVGEDTGTTYGSPLPSRCPEGTGSPVLHEPALHEHTILPAEVASRTYSEDAWPD